MGLELPGLRARKRDVALKAAAGKLNEGFRQLVRDVFNLGAPKGQKVKAGMEAVAPGVKQGARDYLAWYQDLLTKPDGTLNADATDTALQRYRDRYEQLRQAVASRSGTTAPPGDALYTPPAKGDWDKWAETFKAELPKFALGGGAVLAAALVVFLLLRSSSEQRVVLVERGAA
ncbi:MAG: hypothetical protein MPL62_06910 [Alphaproteobacteria bacterium]|nr:hypothetical protein [Alphaproteobacteria bacterium]